MIGLFHLLFKISKMIYSKLFAKKLMNFFKWKLYVIYLVRFYYISNRYTMYFNLYN